MKKKKTRYMRRKFNFYNSNKFWVEKKLIAAIFSCLFICYDTANAQITLSTYPTTAALPGNPGGVSFELTTNKRIEIEEIQGIFTSSGPHNVEVYYRAGGVQSTAGVTPTFAASDGWVLYNTATNISSTAGTLTSIPLGTNLFLYPGTYGFLVNAQGFVSTLGADNWVTGKTDVFTDGNVTLETGPGKGYRALLPLALMVPNQQLAGSVVYHLVPVFADDAQLISIDIPKSVCAGSNNVLATIANNGSNKINSVTVNWAVNGVLQTPVVHSSPIDIIGGTGPSQAQVNLGTFNSIQNQLYDIEVWTSLPNGNSDGKASDDSASTQIATKMSGSYTINPLGTGPANFPSFTDATEGLTERGICGPVVFDATEGLYVEQFAIGPIDGSSATNTITFQPHPNNTGEVEITFSPPAFVYDYVVNFSGCSYVTFDGMKVVTTPISNGPGPAIKFKNEAHHNTVINCRLKAPLQTHFGVNHSVISGFHKNLHYTTIKNCTLIGGANGISIHSAYVTDSITNLTITGNTILNSYLWGIAVGYVKSSVIDSNIISSNSTHKTYTSSATGEVLTATGIRSFNSSVDITGNVIKSPGIWPSQGIYVKNSVSFYSPNSIIANNMVHAGDPTTTLDVKGIYIHKGENIAVAHNNVVIEGQNINAVTAMFEAGSNVEVFNNNLLNDGFGKAVSTDLTVTAMDHNNLATKGALLADYIVGTLPPVIPDLATWKSATPFGQNSISANSIFSNFDSLRTCDVSIKDKGTLLSYASTDIDDEIRDPSPHIGADEFSLDLNEFDFLEDTIIVCGVVNTEIGDFSPLQKLSYSWSTFDTTATITISEFGTYTVTISNNCIPELTDQTEVVDGNPTALFNPIVNGGDVEFINASLRGTSYIWDFGDDNFSVVKSPQHLYATNGVYEVTLTVMNDCDTISITRIVEIKTIGIDEFTSSDVKVYPNPAKDVINLQFNNSGNQNMRIQLLDMKGQLLTDQQINTGNGMVKLNVSNLNRGMYMIRMTSKNGVVNERVLIN